MLPALMKPLVGISCCVKPFGPWSVANHAASGTYVAAVDALVGAVPVLLPANGTAADLRTLMLRLDGIVLTGSRSHVDPACYGGPPHPDGTPEDRMRDATTLPLIRAAIAAGLPLLAICRGMQELNVALGGTLHQHLASLPGRIDHSTPLVDDAAIRTGKAHAARLTEGGLLHRACGQSAVPVNSLHHQGIDRLAPGLVVEATAPDGTIEAVRLPGAPGFVLGVQWHPEFDWTTDAFSRRIFRLFGEAVCGRAIGLAEAAD